MDARQMLHNNYITLKTDRNSLFRAYVAGPEDARRGILLIHGWLGLTKDVEAWADEFARAGYCAMAVDLYDGKVTTTPAEARLLMESVDQAEANAKYAAALNALTSAGRKVAVVGWSYGAVQALHAALVQPGMVAATVMYYPFGELTADKKSLSALNGPIIGQFALDDFAFTPDKREAFASAVEAAGKTLEAHVYDAKHGFAAASGPNFDKATHESALSSTYESLDRYMR
jgi:carboxymethylenebutenolidase